MREYRQTIRSSGVQRVLSNNQQLINWSHLNLNCRKSEDLETTQGKRSSPTAFTADEDVGIPNTLANYFRDKMMKIPSAIHQKFGGTMADRIRANHQHNRCRLMDVHPVHETEVLKLLSSMSAKMSPKDPILTTLLKECRGVFASIITKLANLSITQGIFPSWFRFT